jgi:hypothetical protein
MVASGEEVAPDWSSPTGQTTWGREGAANIAAAGLSPSGRASRTSTSAMLPPASEGRESAPSLPPPPNDDARRSLLAGITPGPAAGRRHAPPPEPRDPGGRARRQGESHVPPSAFGDDFNTSVEAEPYDPNTSEAAAYTERGRDGNAPPPTRIGNLELHHDRPFQPPSVLPVPEIPEPGLVNSAKYAVRFGRARWQRRGAIKTLTLEIKQDTDALDQVLGALGKTARLQKATGKVFSAENNAITAAEERVGVLAKEHGEVDGRRGEEVSKFVEIEREKLARFADAERQLEEVNRELQTLEGQRRGMRDKRKELERRQKAYLKAAEDNDKQSASQQMGDARAELRRSAEQHRKEAASLEPDRQEMDRRLAQIEKPIAEAMTKVEAAKADVETAKRSLSDAREGHGHRLAELDAEQKRKSREMGTAEGEIARRLVTLGTLVNLNRIDDPAFADLYMRIDRLRGAITARTTEIEKLAAEREAFDRGILIRGVAVMVGAVVVLFALIAILRAII